MIPSVQDGEDLCKYCFAMKMRFYQLRAKLCCRGEKALRSQRASRDRCDRAAKTQFAKPENKFNQF